MEFSKLVGVVLARVDGLKDGSEEVLFVAEDGRKWRLYHSQDCCEGVAVNDFDGNVDDLIGSPILYAEESSNSGEGGEHGDSWTWTFYRLATAKGRVTVRWLGTSNGYYSEGVDFDEVRS